MSERERWIVYPLLFLALGAALRDKLFDRTTTKSIVCQELTVVDEEPTGQQPVRVLAKIGRTQSTVGGLSHGYLWVNGQLEVVEQVSAGRQPVPVLFTRTQLAPGNVPYGFVNVSGQLNVDGALNAKQYAIQGVPFVPSLQAVFPVGPNELMRALQQSLPNSPPANAANAAEIEKQNTQPAPAESVGDAANDENPPAQPPPSDQR